MNFHQGILNGRYLSAGRLIKLVEGGDPRSYDALKKLYPHTGNALILGITGPPGSGKSNLFEKLISEFRKEDKKVAVLVFDPTSPITGGAILGDRIRMNRHGSDSGVFIPSIATRGALGGISRAAKGAVIVPDAMKCDVILIETAGIGQIGAYVSLLAHMVIVVCIPEMGDGIQAIKADTLELAVLYVINKADLLGAENVKHELEAMLKFRCRAETTCQPQIDLTSATRNWGIDDLRRAVGSFQQRFNDDARFSEKTRLPFEVADLIVKLPVPNYILFSCIMIIYLIGGCLMDSLGILVLTFPIFFPLGTKLDYNPIWYFVIPTIVTTLGAVTPPVGVKIYVVKAL